MKYTIMGLQQDIIDSLAYSKENKDGKISYYHLDGDDLIILRYILDFSRTEKMYRKVIDNKEYFWIFYESLINELYYMRIKKQALKERFDKYIEMHILEKSMQNGIDMYTHENKIHQRKGSYTYFRFNEKTLEKLLDGKSSVQSKN